MNNTVVYEWLRGDGTPYYIGIGNPRRPYRGKRCCGSPPPRERIVILHEGLDWEKACEIEKELIAFHGRKDLGTGILRNLTNGGEGALGVVISEETRAKMSEAQSGESHPFYGKMGENHPKYGKTLSEETRAKISRACQGRKFSEEHRKKLSKAGLGKKHTKETRAKMSESRRGKKHTEETKEKMSKSQSGENNPRYIPRDWYHPVHGEVLQKSCADLVKMFPEQNLYRGHLSQVALGKQSHHKGWTAIVKMQPTGA